MAVKWSLFYANWYQPPWTDPKICPHSRTLRKFGKNHISPHGQTPLKFGKPHESLVTHFLFEKKGKKATVSDDLFVGIYHLFI